MKAATEQPLTVTQWLYSFYLGAALVQQPLFCYSIRHPSVATFLSEEGNAYPFKGRGTACGGGVLSLPDEGGGFFRRKNS